MNKTFFRYCSFVCSRATNDLFIIINHIFYLSNVLCQLDRVSYIFINHWSDHWVEWYFFSIWMFCGEREPEREKYFFSSAQLNGSAGLSFVANQFPLNKSAVHGMAWITTVFIRGNKKNFWHFFSTSGKVCFTSPYGSLFTSTELFSMKV